MPVAIDLTGQRFGKLTALRDIGRTSRGRVWECLCDCGNVTKVVAGHLKALHIRSCGCLHAESAKIAGAKQVTHGHTTKANKRHASEYHAWASMKSRCLNPSNHSFKRYGARGITICERWMKFENFYADMGPKPSPKHSLERLDTNKGYGPDNCVWADIFQQASTRSNVRSISAFGKTQTAAAWERETGIAAMVIRNRLDAGWPVERALTTPVRVLRRG